MSVGVIQWSIFTGLYGAVLGLNLYQVIVVEPRFKDVGLLNWIFHRLIIFGAIIWIPGSIVLAFAFTDDALNFVGQMLLNCGAFATVLSFLVVIFQTWKNAKLKVDKNEEFVWKTVLGLLFLILVVATPTFLSLFYATDLPLFGAFPDFVFTGVLVASVCCWWILFLDLELYLRNAKSVFGGSKSLETNQVDPLTSLRRLIIGMTLLVAFGGTARIYQVSIALESNTHFRGQQDASQFNAIPILTLIWSAACTYTFWKTPETKESAISANSELRASGSTFQKVIRMPTLDGAFKSSVLGNTFKTQAADCTLKPNALAGVSRARQSINISVSEDII